MWSLPLAMMLLSACATGTSKIKPTAVVIPKLQEYSQDVMRKAADELGHMNPPCDANANGEHFSAVGVDGQVVQCSATHRLVIDYGDLRRKLRAAETPK